MESECGNLQLDLNEARAAYARDMAARDAKIQDQEKHSKSLQSTISNLEQDKSLLEKKLKNLSDSYQSTDRGLAESVSKRKALEEDYSGLAKRFKETTEELKQKQEENQCLGESLTKETNDHNALKTQFSAVTTQLLQAIDVLKTEKHFLDTQISVLSTDLAKAGNSRPRSTRDDGHFNSQFGKLFESFNQWTLTFCRAQFFNLKNLELMDSELIPLYKKVAGPERGWVKIFSQFPEQMIESVLSRYAVDHVFHAPTLLTFMSEQFFRYILNSAMNGVGMFELASATRA